MISRRKGFLLSGSPKFVSLLLTCIVPIASDSLSYLAKYDKRARFCDEDAFLSTKPIHSFRHYQTSSNQINSYSLQWTPSRSPLPLPLPRLRALTSMTLPVLAHPHASSLMRLHASTSTTLPVLVLPHASLRKQPVNEERRRLSESVLPCIAANEQ